MSQRGMRTTSGITGSNPERDMIALGMQIFFQTVKNIRGIGYFHLTYTVYKQL